MVVVGYSCAILMGIILGLIGGGGSILSVPILVYLLEVDPVKATGYSLFVVGISALFGSFAYAKKKEINYKVGGIFAFPAFVGVYSMRAWILPAVPEEIVSVMGVVLTKQIVILLAFALMMILASISMIKKKKNDSASGDVQEKPMNYPLIALEGIVVGMVTGFVGAGGGFLIIPALVILARLEMKIAVGTSLVIISAKSLFGFLGDVQKNPDMDWTLLLIFSAISVVGIFVGSYLSSKVPSEKLKPAFGWFVLIMGSLILVKEVVGLY
jgi:uncharacterized protein